MPYVYSRPNRAAAADGSTLLAVRIASLQPSVALTLASLGRLDTMCACTRYCLEALPELRDRGLPVLPDSWAFGSHPQELRSAQAALALAAPDLVIASVPYRIETVTALLRSGFPVLALAPRTLADVFADIRLIASVIGASEAAGTLIASAQATLQGVRTYTGIATERPTVYCEEWGKPLIRSQPWVAELIETAHGQFLGTPGAHATPDEVAAADPDVLVFAWCGAGNRVPLSRVIAGRGWQHLRAVRERRVFCVPDQLLNTPAPVLLQGLACLSAALHPGLYPPHPELIQLTADEVAP